MRNKYQTYAHLAGVNVETVIYLFAAWKGATWLNESYPQSFDWMPAAYFLALLLIVRSWYVMFRSLIRNQRQNSNDSK